MNQIIARAKADMQRIVLPEGTEERTLKAADKLIADKVAHITLIGNPADIMALAEKHGLQNIGNAIIVDPKNHERKEEYANLLFELRKKKGMTIEEARKLVVLMFLPNKNYGENGIMVFADCAVLPNPNAEELAQIAVSTGHTTRTLAGFEPRIAMLSFSTKGSAKHEMVDKVVEATRIAKEMDSSLKIDGELQADAAIVPAVGMSKAPGSEIAGNANVLVFPSLETGNITYKLVQRLAGAEAVGPILQGIAAPINDLSRGCSVEDIYKMVAITANQAIGMKK